ncbi:polysaccharide lyase family 1 protein [Eremomyces bilateralis CBS 781.70]|uniref:Polysaccharide lyase family 1 protein n=1 Tax=Eremomyces bilateralis CBS 781.70 TaxID=1392243 RepID=A0A6G1G359_9PEZI|nr:polysaccharide lyase family 1 protein [Eremomyces bilateralis CBS 781.70]KAF1812547.1 polysaccharide lyase family 1 protein [Eremomyces bilateralis CBS 781.70]
MKTSQLVSLCLVALTSWSVAHPQGKGNGHGEHGDDGGHGGHGGDGGHGDGERYPLVGFGKDNPLGETTGGAGGPTVTVSTEEALRSAVAGDDKKVVLVKGHYNLTERLKVGSNKSILGHGRGASIVNAGITVNGQTNVIIRNLKVGHVPDNDDVTIQNTTRVWVDHCEFESRISPEIGPDFYDGQLDIVRASDWITVSWTYFHDHWKSSLIGNADNLRDVDFGHLHITYHHNYWRNSGTRGPAGRFGHQHVYNNLYEDFLYQAIHSRSDNQVLVEGNVFTGKTKEALSTYGLVIPADSPNTSPDGDPEIDGFANLGAENDFGTATTNITQTGNFTKAPYEYKLTELKAVAWTVKAGVGLGKI